MTFRVALQNGMQVNAHLCGKMRMKNIQLAAASLLLVAAGTYVLDAQQALLSSQVSLVSTQTDRVIA